MRQTHVQEDPDRQPRRDRLPRDQDGAQDGDRHGRGLFGCRSHALHVRMADEAVHIGPPPANQSYIVIDKMMDAIKATGAEAVHPGYGFLSENPKFAEALEKAGVAFIGPPGARSRRWATRSPPRRSRRRPASARCRATWA
jgi:hypothetical protein